MRSYIKVWITRDANTGAPNGVLPTFADFAEGPYALERYHKDDAIGNLGIFLNPGVQGVKQWRLYHDLQDGNGFVDTGIVIPPEVFAFVAAYNLANYDQHPLD